MKAKVKLKFREYYLGGCLYGESLEIIAKFKERGKLFNTKVEKVVIDYDSTSFHQLICTDFKDILADVDKIYDRRGFLKKCVEISTDVELIKQMGVAVMKEHLSEELEDKSNKDLKQIIKRNTKKMGSNYIEIEIRND